jgi:hypothetical protein
MLRYPPIAEAIQRLYRLKRWFYWDMTPGPGLIHTKTDPLEGSPLIALEAFRKQAGLKVNCLFTEYDADYADQLIQVLAQRYRGWTEAERLRVNYRVECIDHLKILGALRHQQMTDCSAYGLLYWDGLGENIYPAQMLNRWLAKHYYHDLLLMASGTAQKRAGRDRLDILLKTPRLISVSNPVSAFEWIFGLGTNWGELPKKLSKQNHLQFHSTDSKEGKRIIDIVSTTRAQREQRDQGWLWGNEI